MLKRISIRKIFVSTMALCALFLIYLIPNEPISQLDPPKQLEYVNLNIETQPIFLLTSKSYLGMAQVVVNSDSQNVEQRARELLEYLIVGGKNEGKVPSGFRAIIPNGTNILSVKFEDAVLKVDFSKELLDVSEELEEKLISSIVYTLTTIEEVKYVIIYVEGDILNKLPKTKLNLPGTLDRSFGINKEYDIQNTANIHQVTIYYIDKYNQDTFYVPVTKYMNDDRDKIKIVIDSLSSSSIYSSNLMSYLNSNTKLLAVEQEGDSLSLLFNDSIFSDLNEKNILEEVLETICLSVKDNYDVNEVIFQVGEEEIYKSVLKSIE